LGASKILLKVVDLFAERGVFLFEFLDHGDFRVSHFWRLKPRSIREAHNADLKVGSTIV
jgi:hypothetical protein